MLAIIYLQTQIEGPLGHRDKFNEFLDKLRASVRA